MLPRRGTRAPRRAARVVTLRVRFNASRQGQGQGYRGQGHGQGRGVRGQGPARRGYGLDCGWRQGTGQRLASGLASGLASAAGSRGYPDPPLHLYQDGTAPIEAARDDECRLLLGGAAAWLNRAVPAAAELAAHLYGRLGPAVQPWSLAEVPRQTCWLRCTRPSRRGTRVISAARPAIARTRGRGRRGGGAPVAHGRRGAAQFHGPARRRGLLRVASW